MTKYTVEYRILTLAKNAVMGNPEKPARFIIDDIEFSHLNFTHNEGWLENYWIAKLDIEIGNRFEAYKQCTSKLKKIIPRLALISQSYTEFINQPFLITKEDNKIGFFGYKKDRNGTGLMFREKEKEALDYLLSNESIPEEFYYYWNDAVNTIGYSAKLLLMFSALESLAKNNKGKKDFNIINKILGEELTNQLFQQNFGLRHRLIHGEYFNREDQKTDYLDIVHKKVIGYFNKSILENNLINENVVNPQRHIFGNKDTGRFFIQRMDENDLNFREVLNDFQENEFNSPKKHKHIEDKTLDENF